MSGKIKEAATSMVFFFIGTMIFVSAMFLGSQVMDIIGAPAAILTGPIVPVFARSLVGVWIVLVVVAVTVGAYQIFNAIGQLAVLKIKDIVNKGE